MDVANDHQIVPDFSSKLNRTDIEQSFFNQKANHMTMCKFSSADDKAWEDVSRVLKTYCETIARKKEVLQQVQEANKRSANSGS